MIVKVLVPSKLEGFLDILPRLGTDLKVRQGGFLKFQPNPLLGHLPLLRQIGFIAQKDEDCLFLLVVVTEVDPLVEVVESFLVSDYSWGYW